MRKMGLWLLVALVAGWAVTYGLAQMRAREYAAREWPSGLGRIADIPRRYPASATNAAATKLVALAKELEIDFRRGSREQPLPAIRKETTEYVRAQLKRGSGAIAAPPGALATHLAKHADHLAAVRAHLIAEPVRWQIDPSKGIDAPIPNLVATMSLGRLLTANALDRARRGDAGAWDDLHASWMLSRSLSVRPELISQLISLALVRSVNSASRWMPLPEPPWMREVREYDYRRTMLGSWQAEASAMQHETVHLQGLLAVVGRPYLVMAGADTMEHMRMSAHQLAEVSECMFDADAFARRRINAIPSWNKIGRLALPNLASVWQRLYRFQAELEATQRINQIRGGRAPSLDSRCSDGKWLFENGRLHFSVKVPINTNTDMPLEYP